MIGGFKCYVRNKLETGGQRDHMDEEKHVRMEDRMRIKKSKDKIGEGHK